MAIRSYTQRVGAFEINFRANEGSPNQRSITIRALDESLRGRTIGGYSYADFTYSWDTGLAPNLVAQYLLTRASVVNLAAIYLPRRQIVNPYGQLTTGATLVGITLSEMIFASESP